jgi:phosphotransferase system enzyme I (PtsP)
MREQIENMSSMAEFGTVREHHEILQTYKMFAYDEGGRGGSTRRSTAA